MRYNSNGSAVLADRLFSSDGIARSLLAVVCGTALMVICARIEIPAWPVPLTGQTLGLFLTAALLGSARGSLSAAGYLAMGAAGLPVFAGGASGLTAFAGPTAGYLAGFIPAAFIVGLLCERGWSRRVYTTAAAMFIASIVIYIPGIIWLSRFTGASDVFSYGLIPFIPGDLFKILTASLLLPAGWRLVDRQR